MQLQSVLAYTLSALALPAASFSASAGHLHAVQDQPIDAMVFRREINADTDGERQALNATIADMLNGDDVPESSSLIKRIMSLDVPQGPPEQRIQIFGMQASGVSLLWSMLFTNFGHKLEYFGYGGGQEFLDNEDFQWNQTGFWRHAHLGELAKTQRFQDATWMRENVAPIIIVRDPYSWLRSLRNGGNENPLSECTEGDDWLTRPCTHSQPAGHEEKAGSATYPNLGGVWNSFVDSYENATSLGFKRQLIITYEGLMKTPTSVLTRIADFLNQPHRNEWVTPFQLYGYDSDRVVKMSSLHFMYSYESEERKQACESLDHRVLEYFGYPIYDCSNIDEAALDHQVEIQDDKQVIWQAKQ